ncbi:toxin, partial [Staphylococcus epidermidis]
IEHYKQKHGIGTHYGDYSITFEPLRVYKLYRVD